MGFNLSKTWEMEKKLNPDAKRRRQLHPAQGYQGIRVNRYYS
jgi:hypothetical protein